MKTNSIQVEKVFKAFEKNKNVLNGINLTTKTGGIYALIGSSGCGKTTLLNCIMRMYKVDSGIIKMFDQKIELKKTSELLNFIGFIPQEISLVPQLTIKETFEYFANLHSMNQKKFNMRILMISDLLELPALNEFIGNLSGGQQRRISLAVSFIHDPKVLILDEPTVGLDFELRNKIWNFFYKQTSKNGLSVLITTHCMNEVAKSHRCGFMMNGKIIIEDKPSLIKEKLNVETFDDAFYQLYLKVNQFKVKRNSVIDLKFKSKNDTIDRNLFKIRLSVIKGLLVKDFHRLKRSYIEAILLFLTTFSWAFLFSITFGHYPNDLKIGVLNYEAYNCENYSIVQDGRNMKLSCEYFDQIHGVEKNFYNSQRDAIQDLKNRKIISLITVNENFSNSLITKSQEIHDLEIFLDYSDYYFAIYMKYKICDTFRDFLHYQSKKFRIRRFYLNIYNIEYLYMQSTSIFKFIKSVATSDIILLSSIAMISSSVIAIIQSRVDGIWNRSLLNGVQTSEIIIAYLIQYSCYAIITSIELILSLKFIFQIEIIGNVWLAFTLIFINAMNVFLFGFNVSIISKDVTIAGYTGIGLLVILNSLSGIIWPIQGISKWIQPLQYFFPISLTCTALHGIVFKGYEILQKNVLEAFVVIISNNILLIFSSIFNFFFQKIPNQVKMNRSQSKSSKNRQRSRSKSTRRNQSKKSEKKSKSTSRNIQVMDNGDTLCLCIPSSAIYFQNLGKNARMIEKTSNA
ncbi:hypothetical protein PVAND_000868 [Polypedilum vanderplanki]|uniref:ABC transporter domain-containing protein n=1 Tax=Polypedilum vanderplanki TaxID=319348 RepID=A0A9J6BMD7_POLVA|nr:hypothetical protein PVAND_000868 [Polypedilum vanderplanki]